MGCVLNTCNVSMVTDDNNLSIGRPGSYSSEYFSGVIDEVRISNTARSAEEVAEAYRAGRDHKITRTISSTDLSSKNKIPFYIAADRPGTYLEATAGESAFANYEPDANTLAFWHLDEKSGSGSYIKDSSGNGYHAAVTTGTSAVEGKIGKARKFVRTSSEYLTAGSVPLANVSFSVDFWAKRASTGTYYHIVVGEGSSMSTDKSFHMGFRNTNTFTCGFYGDDLDTGAFTDIAGWHHWVCTYDAGTNDKKIYQDGQLIAQGTAIGDFSGSGPFLIGRPGYNTYYFDGMIDEIRVSNIVRTASEIRQAFEVGRRTHPITIDFAASLDSGNLITGTSDTSFTIDATIYGTQNKGDNLYSGDKIIVRENYDGTEYAAQGTVSSVNDATGAVTVNSWDSGSTAPSGGYTTEAVLFKWQREYWDVTGSMDNQIDAVTKLTLRQTDGNEGRTIYLDDFESLDNYLTDPAASGNFSSSLNRYCQYRTVFSSSDAAVSSYVSSVSTTYTDPYNEANVFRGSGQFKMQGDMKMH